MQSDRIDQMLLPQQYLIDVMLQDYITMGYVDHLLDGYDDQQKVLVGLITMDHELIQYVCSTKTFLIYCLLWTAHL